MDVREWTETPCFRDRLAQLPLGLIFFIVFLIALSYYFDGPKSNIFGSILAALQLS